jgi:hypothetical protein
MCIYQERKFYLYKRGPNFLVHARPLKSQSRDCGVSGGGEEGGEGKGQRCGRRRRMTVRWGGVGGGG